jgi:hypothetical protein
MKRSVVLWLLSLMLVGIASAWISAQATVVRPLDQPIVLSGQDIAVQVEAWNGNAAYGKLVVRLDGR